MAILIPEPPLDIPEPPSKSWPSARFYLVPALGTFLLSLSTFWLIPDPVCEASACHVVSAAFVIMVLAEPLVVLIVLSVRAADAAGRVSMPVRSILAAAIPASFWGGELLGEWLSGATSVALAMLLIVVPVATLFTWPLAFLISTFTSWTTESRRSVRRRRAPAPIRADL